MACFDTSLLQISDSFFIHVFCPIIFLIASGEMLFQNVKINQLIGWNFRVVQQNKVCPRTGQDFEQVNFYTNRRTKIA